MQIKTFSFFDVNFSIKNCTNTETEHLHIYERKQIIIIIIEHTFLHSIQSNSTYTTYIQNINIFILVDSEHACIRNKNKKFLKPF